MTLGITKELLAGDTADAALVLAKVSSISQPLRVMQKQADPSAWEAIKNFAADAWGRDDVRKTLTGAGVGAGVGALSSMFRSGKDKSNFLNSIITGGLAGGGIGYGLHTLANSELGDDWFGADDAEARVTDVLENRDIPGGGILGNIADGVVDKFDYKNEDTGQAEYGLWDGVETTLGTTIGVGGLTEATPVSQAIKRWWHGRPNTNIPVNPDSFKKELTAFLSESPEAKLYPDINGVSEALNRMTPVQTAAMLKDLGEGNAYHISPERVVTKGLSNARVTYESALGELDAQLKNLTTARQQRHTSEPFKADLDKQIKAVKKSIKNLRAKVPPTDILSRMDKRWLKEVVKHRPTHVPWYRGGTTPWSKGWRGAGGIGAAMLPSLALHYGVNQYGLAKEELPLADAIMRQYRAAPGGPNPPTP